MSGLVNKAKDVLSGNKTHDSTTGHTTSTHGHSGNTVHDTSTLNTTHGTHPGGYSTGQPGYGHNTTTTTAGPHSSNVANKLDPRVDSDADHRNNPTSAVGGGYGQTSSAYGTTPGHGTTTGGGYGTTSATHGTTAGPHSSNIANKLDPRVDSDVDHRNNPTSVVGGYGQGTSAYGTTGSAHNTTTGPHSSKIANKLDPRVDSDADHRGNPSHAVGGGYGQTHASSGYGPTSTTSGTGTTGPHSSNLANKLDPRVDSDADHRANPHSRAGGY